MRSAPACLVALIWIGCGDDTSTGPGSGGATSASTASTVGATTTTTSSSSAGEGGSTSPGSGGDDPAGSGGDGAGGAATGGDGAGGRPVLAADESPCSAHDDCEGGVCLLEEVTGHPGGSCATPCDPGDAATCDGVCAYEGAFGAVCHASCLGEESTCRPGYACRTSDFETFACRPDCQSADDCPTTGHCATNSGRCVPPETVCDDLLDDNDDDRVDCADAACEGDPACVPGTAALGAPCTTHSDCASASGQPLCLSEELTGYPGGTCAQFCSYTVPEIAPCELGGFCVSSLVFSDADPSGGDPIAHCNFAACDADEPCRDGYACCQGNDCQAVAGTCRVGCTSDDQCADTGRDCGSPQNGWPAVCKPPLPVEICDNDECDDACADLAAALCGDAADLSDRQEGETAPGAGIGGDGCLYSDVIGEVSPTVYRLVAEATGTLTLTLDSVFPQAVAVVEGCDLETDQHVACEKDGDFDGHVEVEAEIVSGTTYFVLVWPVGPGHEDDYTLTAEVP
jgi:hypothetical protein